MVGIAFSVEELRGYAAKAGLSLQFVVKEAFLFELVELLEGQGLVLKGGTAINKAYLYGHQRFSEDLDYDTDEGKSSVRCIVRNTGWKVKKEFFTKRSIGFLFEYEFGGIKDVVKADFSFKIDGGFGKARLSSDFLPLSKRTTIYDLPDLIRQKEAAFETRLEWKDLYDLYWLSQLRPSEFRITDTERFATAINSVSVPKTANAFIPAQKRPNWEQLKQELQDKATHKKP